MRRAAIRGARCACALGTLAAALLVGGCGVSIDEGGAERPLRVVTTTGILKDLVEQVGGERTQVSSIVPNGADPHSYEPSLRDVREVVYADLAFSNYLLLEEHAIIRTLDANLPPSSPSVSIAEAASQYGATILPLVENRALDSVWLGLRVTGRAEELGGTRSSVVSLSLVGADVPEGGAASAWVTTTFGTPAVAFDSADGIDAPGKGGGDTETLPIDAHQHMSWGFTKPGIYRLDLAAHLTPEAGDNPHDVGAGTILVAVGVDPGQIAAAEGRHVISAGHADVSVDLEAKSVGVMVDSTPSATAGSMRESHWFDADQVMISVPPSTITHVPGTSGYRFLGHPGDPVYLLPQAVLGKHVHGEIDPHLWHDIHNARAYVEVIRDQLIGADPQGRQFYTDRAEAYLDELAHLDEAVTHTLASIPPSRRHLVTTTDAYSYLAHAYGLSIAGFIAPHPGTEPTVADRMALATALEDLDIPAVFLEPTQATTRSVLRTVAEESGVQVCPLYGDTLDHQVSTYVELMTFNASSLATCLGS